MFTNYMSFLTPNLIFFKSYLSTIFTYLTYTAIKKDRHLDKYTCVLNRIAQLLHNDISHAGNVYDKMYRKTWFILADETRDLF